MPQWMYTDEKMERQLLKGNVGEALFRLWFEEHSSQFPNLVLVQQGYNPAEIIRAVEKREKLKRSSDPDFAVTKGDNSGRLLLGISINTQKQAYTTHSTMGGYCIRCPRALSCLDGNEKNLWYNRYNITNDYPQFRRRNQDIDVLLVTLMVSSIDTLHKWIMSEGLGRLTLDYIYEGRAGIAGQNGAEKFLNYLMFGARRQKRKIEMHCVSHDDIISGKVPHFVTGGLSQFGRPREVCCVDIRLAGNEENIVARLAHL